MTEADLATARGIREKWQRIDMCFNYDGHLLLKAEKALDNAIAAALQAQYEKGFEDGKAAR